MDATTARLVDLLYTYREDVGRFLRHGKACFVAVCLLSVSFLLARALMPYLCARFLGIEGGSLRQIVEAQIALIFLVFFAPTPGGAGIAEGASLSIMADIVPPGIARLYNLLWRLSTTPTSPPWRIRVCWAGPSPGTCAHPVPSTRAAVTPRVKWRGGAMTIADFAVHLVLGTILIVGGYQFYFWCQRNPLRPTRELRLALDDRIPYWPAWVWIYSFLYYPVILYTTWVVDSSREFVYLAVSFLGLLAMQMAFFVLFPVETPANPGAPSTAAGRGRSGSVASSSGSTRGRTASPACTRRWRC